MARKALAGDVRQGGEGMGRIQGDRIAATFGFDNGVTATFGTHKAKDGAGGVSRSSSMAPRA